MIYGGRKEAAEVPAGDIGERASLVLRGVPAFRKKMDMHVPTIETLHPEARGVPETHMLAYSFMEEA